MTNESEAHVPNRDVAGEPEASASGLHPGTHVPGSPESTGPDELQILEALKQVHDPELMINVVDLGLIYNLQIHDGIIDVEMTLTSPACPAGPQMIEQAKSALKQLEGVEKVNVNLVMTPPWTPDRMTEEARDQLGIF